MIVIVLCTQAAAVCCLADIIDENLKTALQKDLNVMAPGLTIQVFKHTTSALEGHRKSSHSDRRIWLAQNCNILVIKPNCHVCKGF